MVKRVLLITQWFDPEPTFKGLLFAKELVRQGFVVEVLTGFPNYPGGNVYSGYAIKLLQREVVDGVFITRVPLYPNHGQSAIKRVLNYVSFAASSLFYGLFMAQRPDVIYAYHPPLTVGISAVLIRFFRRIPVVLDIQDMWPDTLRATGMVNNAKALSIVGAVCNWVYRNVDLIAVLSPGFKRLLIAREVPIDKIRMIYNWADEEALTLHQGSLPSAFPGTDFFRIVFAGNMGKAQSLDAVLKAASLLKTRGSKVCFVLIGGGVESTRLEHEARDLGLSNVFFFPPVPMAEIGTVLHAADALLVHLRKDPLFEITVPSKTQAYMAVGKPILMAVSGDAADLIVQANAGVVANPEDAESIANAAEKLQNMSRLEREEMGKNAHTYYHEHLSLAVGVRQFGTIFNSI
ncbi:glycosyltransferase family 4 protein [Undibacterium sp.]|uniref:glycosyltransferase family 4 protein n=1 Tax=Undibacterium sp. TaxID=1914977 RepID=UPI003750E58C